MLDHTCQLPMPIFLEWNRRTVFGKYIFSSNGNWNNFCTSYDSHSVFSNMRETSWHLLRLGTLNLIDVLPQPMLSDAFHWRIALFKDRSKTMLHQVCVILWSFISNCSILKQISGEIISFSMIRPSVLVI